MADKARRKWTSRMNLILPTHLFLDVFQQPIADFLIRNHDANLSGLTGISKGSVQTRISAKTEKNRDRIIRHDEQSPSTDYYHSAAELLSSAARAAASDFLCMMIRYE